VKRDTFAKQACDLVQTFKDVGLVPTASAWSTGGGPIVVVNYWDMGTDANVLLEAELALPDVPKFNAFNNILQREIKNIVVPIARGEITPIPGDGKLPGEDFRYLRVKSEVPTAQLAEFVARVEGDLGAFTKECGWLLGATYFGITGTEGLFSQLWLVRSAKCKDVAKHLQSAPWLDRNLVREGSPSFQILEATRSDPVVQAPADSPL
jgi:hypothetical protein